MSIWLFIAVSLAFGVFLFLRKPKKEVRSGDIIDSVTLHNALRKQEGKSPFKVIDGDKR